MKIIKKNTNMISTNLGNLFKLKHGNCKDNRKDNSGIYNLYGSGGIIGTTNEKNNEGNSITIARKGSLNKPLLIKEPYSTIDTAFSTYDFKINVDYIYKIIKNINFEKYSQSSNRPSLTKTIIEKIKVSIHEDVRQQEKTASVLSLQERQIEIIETLIEKLEKRNQYYAEKLLSGEKRIRKNEQGEIEFYDNTEWQEVSLNGKIVSIPKGWMKMKISDFFEINMGKTILSKNISKNYNNNNNIPVFSATEMFKVFGYVDIKTINKNRLLKENDLVIGARGTIGSVHKMNGLSTSTQTTIQCRRKEEDNNICFHYIKCNRKNIFKHEGGAIPQLTVASMNMLEIIYKKEDAYNINNFLSLLDKELNILKKILIKEKLRFQWMLDNLLSGEYEIID